MPGQHQIENHEIRPARARSCGMTVAPGRQALDAVPRLLQVVRDELGDVLVVFDDENMGHSVVSFLLPASSFQLLASRFSTSRCAPSPRVQ